MAVNYVPTYSDAMAEAQRQQRLAELLQQQAQEPIQTPTYQGIAAMPSYAAGLAKILNAYGARKASEQAIEAQKQAKQIGKSEFMDYLQSLSPEQKTVGVGTLAGMEMAKPSLVDGQIVHTPPTATATMNQQVAPATTPTGQVDFSKPMQMQIGGALTPAQRRAKLLEGMASDNPMVQAIAQAEYAKKPEEFDIQKTAQGLVRIGKTTGSVTPVAFGNQVLMPTETLRYENQPPHTAGGMQYNRDTKKWEEIPGFTKQAERIAAAQTAGRGAGINTDAVDALAQRYVAGDKSALTGMGRSTGAMSAIQNRVAQILREQGASPTEITNNMRKLDLTGKTEKEFTSGSTAKTIQSLNAFTQHAAALEDLANALDRGDNTAINAAKIAYQNLTGNSAPNNIAIVGQLVADELQKAALGAPGGQAEREQLTARLTGAKSGKVIVDAINQGRGLAAGQLGALKKKYESGYGTGAFEDRFLTPEAASALGSHGAKTMTSGLSPAEEAEYQQLKAKAGK